MLRKICPIGNSRGVSIPKDMLERLNLDIGSKVDIEIDERHKRIVIEAVEEKTPAKDIDREFASQVDGFIKKYRTALKALAGK